VLRSLSNCVDVALPEISPKARRLLNHARVPASCRISKAKGAPPSRWKPKAWLGTAYHKVLEKVVECDFAHETLESLSNDCGTSIAHKRSVPARTHSIAIRLTATCQVTTSPTLVYFCGRENYVQTCGPAEREMAERRTKSLAAHARAEFVAFAETRWKPIIRADEVIDYKSGAISKMMRFTGGRCKRHLYRQLRIYGYWQASAGRWPRRGLLPLVGAGVDIVLEPTECTRESENGSSARFIQREVCPAGASQLALLHRKLSVVPI